MKKSIKLALRASEIRSDINKLDPGEESIEKRRELLGSSIRSRRNTAPRSPRKPRPSATAARRARHHSRGTRVPGAGVAGRAAHAFHAVMDGKPLTGAAKELQEHAGLSGHDLPWDMIAPRMRSSVPSTAPMRSRPRRPTRTCNSTASSAACSARSATATLGVAMPQVATGEQNYPVVTTSDRAQILAKDAAEPDSADAGITAHVIEPVRLQRSYVIRREDQAVLSGLEEALRNDLSMAVSDLLDAQVLAGDGTTGAQFDGFLATAANGGIADRSDTPARATFALAAGEVARGIDGKYAGGLSECAVVIGDDTARDLASKFQTNDSDSALAYAGRTTMRTMASANIPAVAAMFQEGILARMGAAGANALCPMWSGVQCS